MNHDQIHEKLTEIFRDVFDDPRLTISDTTTAPEVEGWDSISHISLIVAVEKSFGVTFNTKDVKSLANVGDFVRLIASRVR